MKNHKVNKAISTIYTIYKYDKVFKLQLKGIVRIASVNIMHI